MDRKGCRIRIQRRFFSSAFTVVVCQQQPRRHGKNERNLLCGEGAGCNACLSRWSTIISSLCSFGLKKTKKKKKVENCSDQHGDGEIAESMKGGASSSSSLKDSGSSPSGEGREVYFNLGVGFGIIHLIAASKYELNKMVELSKQMEALLQDLKKLPLQNTQINYSEPSVGSTSDAAITTQSEAQHGGAPGQRSDSFQRQNPADLADEIQNSYSTKLADMDMKAKAKKKIDQLEAELEVELEHLQVQLDSEITANCEYITTEISIEDSAPEDSIDEQAFEIEPRSESEVMIGDVENNDNNGVCPVELERRLHELLATRQEEKIKALESALDSAIQKLRENQNELSWWKGTATLAFQKNAPQ